MASSWDNDWVEIARNNPSIAAWFAQLTRGTRRLDEMGALMKRDKSYDYKTAIQEGIRPSIQADGLYHWPSYSPSGKKLKAKGHPTENKALGPLHGGR